MGEAELIPTESYKSGQVFTRAYQKTLALV